MQKLVQKIDMFNSRGQVWPLRNLASVIHKRNYFNYNNEEKIKMKNNNKLKKTGEENSSQINYRVSLGNKASFLTKGWGGDRIEDCIRGRRFRLKEL